MKRGSRLTFAVSLAFAPIAITTAVAQEQAAPEPDRTLIPYASARDSVRLPDGRMLHFVCMGQGSPTVILTAGAGGWGINWSKVQPAVATRTRVCAWDRAGFGLSGPPPQPQSVAETTSDLEAGLARGKIAGPYIVVGHSLGGYESLLLKDRQPANVVGMVLVDSSIPDQVVLFDRATPIIAKWMRTLDNPVVGFLQKCAAGLRAGTVRHGGPDPDGCLHPQWPPSYPPELRTVLDAMAGEAEPHVIAAALDTIAFYASPSLLDRDAKAVIRPGRSYGSMPLVVLTAGDFQSPPDFPAAMKAEIPLQRAEWARGHDAFAALSTRGVHRVVAGSSHDIPEIKPQAVIDAIDEVVDQARSAGKER
jgi:pimeloyl-ACP methyl ester carboxylesterase